MPREFNGKYEFKTDGINSTISERGDLFLALREVRWSENKDYKLDLRNYKSDEYGDKTLKGVSFTEEDADELVKVLIENGFGDDKEIVSALMDHRPNICYELGSEGYDDNGVEDERKKRLFTRLSGEEELDDDSDSSLDDFYDPREVMG